MAIHPDWRPNPAHGAFTIGRQIVVVAGANFTKIDFRTDPWFAQCPWLVRANLTGADAIARGVLRRLKMRFVPNAENAATNAAADALQVADEDPGAGGDKFVGVAIDNPLDRNYDPWVERHYIWVRAPAAGGNIVVDIELNYDVYTAA